MFSQLFSFVVLSLYEYDTPHIQGYGVDILTSDILAYQTNIFFLVVFIRLISNII